MEANSTPYPLPEIVERAGSWPYVLTRSIIVKSL